MSILLKCCHIKKNNQSDKHFAFVAIVDLVFCWGFFTTWNIEILALQWVYLIIQHHTEIAWVHSRKQLSGNAISECYLCSLTLFSTLLLDSVNLEKHNIHKNGGDIFWLTVGFLWSTNLFFYLCCAIMRKQEPKQLTKGKKRTTVTFNVHSIVKQSLFKMIGHQLLEAINCAALTKQY